ncbi:MAG: hypothetical protein HFJ47_03790 [Clostridia bacterium]|nr:hypothetical protein [Clostridia bacterium]
MRMVSINLRKNENVIKLEESAPYDEILTELEIKLVELKKLYQDETTPIRVIGKTLNKEEKIKLQEIIRNYIDVEVSFEMQKGLGLSSIVKPFSKETDISETRFYKGSLRSGQKIEVEGSIIIFGDVNSGAEVMATENIVILGTLRGLAHAGARGNVKATIVAETLDTVQLRIANIIKELVRSESTVKKHVYITVDNNKIKIGNY